MSPFPLGSYDTSHIPLAEIASWLAHYGGMTLDQVSQVEGYIEHLLSKEAHSTMAA
jgi:hypothetical protein